MTAYQISLFVQRRHNLKMNPYPYFKLGDTFLSLYLLPGIQFSDFMKIEKKIVIDPKFLKLLRFYL